MRECAPRESPRVRTALAPPIFHCTRPNPIEARSVSVGSSDVHLPGPHLKGDASGSVVDDLHGLRVSKELISGTTLWANQP